MSLIGRRPGADLPGAEFGVLSGPEEHRRHPAYKGAGWTAGAVVNIDGQSYRTYTAGRATLLVDTDITAVA